jgi:hypothetical protein
MLIISALRSLRKKDYKFKVYLGFKTKQKMKARRVYSDKNYIYTELVHIFGVGYYS